MSPTIPPARRHCKLTGQVGIDGLADQLVNKSVARGYQFNILCIGETGIGKTTLVETLFNRKFNRAPTAHSSPEVGISTEAHTLKEANVNLQLAVSETVGFGDQNDMQNSSQPIVKYLDSQFASYLTEEQKIRRNLHQLQDTRIHLCLYFFHPTGHGMRAIDLVTLTAISKKVNVVPVIGRADALTKSELTAFRAKLADELKANKIDLFSFPTDDDDISESNAKHNALMPFAVVGSTEEMKVGNKVVRARQYPWGTVQVENESHCDFVALREMIIRTNMLALIESTHNGHYASFRAQQMHEMGISDTNGGATMHEAMEEKRKELMTQYDQKERDLKKGFMHRVQEKETELKEQEKALHQKFDQIKAKHTAEKKAIEEDRRKLDEDMTAFEEKKAHVNSQLEQQSQLLNQHATLPGKGKKR